MLINSLFALSSLAALALADSGVYIKNNGWYGTMTYNFYPNYQGYGAVGAAMQPLTSVTVAQGEEVFVPLAEDFKGRVQRGSHQVATWAEFQMADDKGVAWGDISLQAGYNGPVTIEDAAGNGAVAGFTKRLLPIAREQISASDFADQTVVTDTGLALKATGSNGELSPFLVKFESDAIGGMDKAYLAGGSGVTVANSKTCQFRITFY